MIRFPRTFPDAAGTGQVRAGGTDLQELRRHHIVARDPLVDLRDTGNPLIREVEGGVSIDAMTRLSTVARHARVPALVALAASKLANPHIRAVATMAGSLLQANRCWYFRDPATTDCWQRGGEGCAARAGDHSRHAVFDRSPCVAVHPSTLGMALLAYDALVETTGAPLTITALYGDGADPTRDQLLPPGAVVTAVVIRDAWPGETAGYQRAISRHAAEWALAEAGVRLVVEGGTIRAAAVVVGAVARVPLRLPAVEAALVGKPATPDTLAVAAALATQGANPLPMTAYKLPLLAGVVLGALEQAAGVTG